MRLAPDGFCAGAVVAAGACAKARRGELADPLTLDANYVRRTDAELHWKES